MSIVKGKFYGVEGINASINMYRGLKVFMTNAGMHVSTAKHLKRSFVPTHPYCYTQHRRLSTREFKVPSTLQSTVQSTAHIPQEKLAFAALLHISQFKLKRPIVLSFKRDNH